MQSSDTHTNNPTRPTDDLALNEALTALGRAINIISTYGNEHPAFEQAIESAHAAMQKLFSDRKKVSIGAVNGALAVDGTSIAASGILLKSLERRLVRLGVTGLRIARNISREELFRLVELLASKEAAEFDAGIGKGSFVNVTTENTRYEAVHDDQTVANKADLANSGGNGILVLEDDLDASGGGGGNGESSVHVDQIVAFLKGDVESDENDIGDQLTELASDPDRLGQMIMESVAIRQTASELSGESLSDIILGCLRRTYNGLRKQPAFQTSEGMADLQKSLLLLEESMLEKIRLLAGDTNPELDREIVQAIREMDENLGFERAAKEYVEHRDAIEQNKQQLQSFLQAQGAETAEGLLERSGFPGSDWRKIVVASERAGGGANPPIASGLNTLATVFEKLENLMQSEHTDGNQVQDLLGQANDTLDGTLSSTQKKLDSLSKKLKEDDTGTIGGQARKMNRKELLSSISEVAQELMQPLTAINASLEMMLHGYVGQVTNDQRDMLTLAYNSGEHLKHLMDDLVSIVGYPTNKGVDHRFHTTSEEVLLMKKS